MGTYTSLLHREQKDAAIYASLTMTTNHDSALDHQTVPVGSHLGWAIMKMLPKLIQTTLSLPFL